MSSWSDVCFKQLLFLHILFFYIVPSYSMQGKRLENWRDGAIAKSLSNKH